MDDPHDWVKGFATWCCRRDGCLVFLDPKTGRYFDGATMQQGDHWRSSPPPCVDVTVPR